MYLVRDPAQLGHRLPPELDQAFGGELLVAELAAGLEVRHPDEVHPLLLAVVAAADVEDVHAVADAGPDPVGRQVQTHLLAQLAAYGVDVGLAGVDAPAWHAPHAPAVAEDPAAGERPVLGVDEQHADGGTQVQGGVHAREPRTPAGRGESAVGEQGGIGRGCVEGCG